MFHYQQFFCFFFNSNLVKLKINTHCEKMYKFDKYHHQINTWFLRSVHVTDVREISRRNKVAVGVAIWFFMSSFVVQSNFKRTFSWLKHLIKTLVSENFHTEQTILFFKIESYRPSFSTLLIGLNIVFSLKKRLRHILEWTKQFPRKLNPCGIPRISNGRYRLGSS